MTTDPRPDNSHYLHGTSTEEQSRLSKLNEMLNESPLREMNLRPGDRILDVGCGLGQLSRGMARLAGPRGYVLGLDRSGDQISQAQALAAAEKESNLVEFRQGNAYPLELRTNEWKTFDVVHTRFLLEHVREPLEVVRQMAQALKPGGRMILQDDSHDILRLHPQPPGFERSEEPHV